ncbi:MAG: acetyl-CoA carboxylase carboxyltransferase subunit alpha [Kiritimatiellae bacterium]|nr:acetyl-CoA carboxylase carboxyltransferase subunit alpha [Kiritimatiellia bacterium]
MDFEGPLAEVEARIAELKKLTEETDANFSAEIEELEKKRAGLLKDVYANLNAWEAVQVARHQDRPLLRDYIARVFSEFVELRGDRYYGDDRAMIGGFAMLDGRRVMLIGHEKGRTVEEKVESNFGMAKPEGYRKALRLMKLADKFGLPIVCLIDTPAAFPGVDAEERGQAEAIARNLTEMVMLSVPIIVVVTGEGGSGGAIGIGVGDVVLMLANAIYSVIPPEGCAAILWRDSDKAPEAAEALKLTADALLRIGIVDGVIPEPPGGAHRDHAATTAAVKEALIKHVDKLKGLSGKKLRERRLKKYTNMGHFQLPR